MASLPRRGEVWLARLPDDPKVRPVLIVSPDARNAGASSVLVVPITTNFTPSPTHVPLPAREGGLNHDSMARCENVGYLFKHRLDGRPLGGVIRPAAMREAERALARALDLVAVTP